MFQTQLLRDEHVEPLAAAVCAVLEQTGVLIQQDELLQALDRLGARVDFAAQRARFPVPMTREYVASFRQQYNGTLHDRFAPPPRPRLDLQVAQYYYDWPTRRKRSGNREDFVALIKLGDVLHGEAGVGHCLLQAEVPPVLEPLYAALTLAEFARRPRWVYPMRADQRPYIEEMGAILGADDDFCCWTALCFAHPLRFDREPADRLVAQARAGVPVGLVAMPVAGITTPVTVEGFIAVAAAEVVAGWICGRAINPEVPLGGSMWAATVDMRTGQPSYSAPDAMYMAFAVCEFLRRWTGFPFPPGAGEYCDSAQPGLYAVMEKAYKAMMVAAFTGYHPGLGQGMLECGKTLAPVQLLLERDFVPSLDLYGGDVQPVSERIALPTIAEVDLGLETNFLQSDHTLRFFRQSVWLPELFPRAGWTGAGDELAILDRAQAEFEELLGDYRKPEGREDQLAAMRQVLKRAAKDYGVRL